MDSNSKQTSYWREFENNKVSHSAAHYLMAVDRLKKSLGYARITDIADELSVSRGASSMAVSHLKKRNLITEDPNRFLLLTEEGQQMADEVEHNFVTLSGFFGKILGVPHEVAMSDACKTEHLLSRETCRRLVRLMHYILSDDQRAEEYRTEMDFSNDETEFDESMDFAPALDEATSDSAELMETTGLKSLTDVPIGNAFVVSDIQGGKAVIDRLKSLGIRAGTKVTKIRGKNRGTVVIEHGRNQTALGFGVCKKIIVEAD